MTRTIALLRVSPETFQEIDDALSHTEGYEHVVGVHGGKRTLDMDGIALQTGSREEFPERVRAQAYGIAIESARACLKRALETNTSVAEQRRAVREAFAVLSAAGIS